jgi:hypothetical protein
MDKSLLVYLSRAEFQEVADSLRQQLPNSVIRGGLKVWPKGVYGLAGEEFERKLRSRRDQLPAVAHKFYELLAREVEIPGTDQPERFVVEKPAPQQLRVSVYRRFTATPDSLIGQRTFHTRETHTLKLFGLGGNDMFELRAFPAPGLALRIYDGAGQDVVQAVPSDDHTRATVFNSGDGNVVAVPPTVKVKAYRPQAEEFDAAGWLLRHRLY